MIAMNELLANCPLFKGISEHEIIEIKNTIRYQIKRFEANECLALSSVECRHLHIVLEGSVRGEMVDSSGKIIKIEDIAAPRPLAVAFLFGQNNFYPVDIITNETTEILSFPKESVVELMQKSSAFLKNYMDLISSRAQFLSDRIKFLSFQTIKGKLGNYFLSIMKENSTHIELAASQTTIAEMFGVARPSLARAIRELHNDGVINAKGKYIEIIDKKALISLVNPL